MKDLVLFVLGVIVGFLFGVVIYWLPLKQFKNEILSLWNLCSMRLARNDRVKLRVGTKLKPVAIELSEKEVSNEEHEWIIWHDEGVGWHFTSHGWLRARIFQVADPSEDRNPLYKVCHLDLV